MVDSDLLQTLATLKNEGIQALLTERRGKVFDNIDFFDSANGRQCVVLTFGDGAALVFELPPPGKSGVTGVLYTPEQIKQAKGE